MDAHQILKAAQSEKYAIGSFNFSTAEILKAIVLAAQKMKSPIIVSTSEKEAEFIGYREAAALVKAWKIATKLPIILNLDHGKSFNTIKKALAAGYDAVHFDGSSLSYVENIQLTKKVVNFAHDFERTFEKRVLVEGELGYLRGTSSLYDQKAEIETEDLTDPEQAKEFAEKTKIDSLAIAIGSAHGIYTQGGEKLHLKKLAKIQETLGGKIFLVLHGGSGIPDTDIKKAIKSGIVKININTEMRVAYKEALEEEIKKNPKETTPYKILEPGLKAVQKVVEKKIKLFGSGDKI